jgi:DNA polymerase III subunit epsilon
VRLLGRRQGAAARFAQVRLPAAGTPWLDAQWCSIDLELTGLDPGSDEIIAIGAVPISEGQVQLGESIYTLARPDSPPQAPAVLVHKLLSAELADAPELNDAIDLLLDAMAGKVPVFHTSIVERTFLGRELRRRRLRLPLDADTEVLGRVWMRERDGIAPTNLPLAGLAADLGQPQEDPHHALGDAITTAKAFIALAAHLDSVRPQTVGSLQQPEPRALQRFGL